MSFYTNIQDDKLGIAAIDDEGNFLTYKNLHTFSQMISNSILSRSLVFLLCENTIGCFAGFAAFLNNHVIPLLLDASIDREYIWNLIAIYRPDYLYLPDRFRGDFPEYLSGQHQFGYLLLKTNFADQPSVHNDLALLLSTSGSTGSPKQVRLSYNNLLSNGTAIVNYLGISSDDRPITTLPFQYSFGFSIINSHLLAGATVLLTTHSIVEKGFWEFFREERATSFGGGALYF